eukprot:2201398-Prymnesium_polylepis.1
MESGGALVAPQDMAIDYSSRYAVAAGCGGHASAASRLACLQKVPLKTLRKASSAVASNPTAPPWTGTSFGWGCSVDGTTIIDNPADLIRQRKINAVRLLAGTNTNEGTEFTYPYLPDGPLNATTYEHMVRMSVVDQRLSGEGGHAGTFFLPQRKNTARSRNLPPWHVHDAWCPHSTGALAAAEPIPHAASRSRSPAQRVYGAGPARRPLPAGSLSDCRQRAAACQHAHRSLLPLQHAPPCAGADGKRCPRSLVPLRPACEGGHDARQLGRHPRQRGSEEQLATLIGAMWSRFASGRPPLGDATPPTVEPGAGGVEDQEKNGDAWPPYAPSADGPQVVLADLARAGAPQGGVWSPGPFRKETSPRAAACDFWEAVGWR